MLYLLGIYFLCNRITFLLYLRSFLNNYHLPNSVMAMTGGGVELVHPPCFHHRSKTTSWTEQPTRLPICAALSKQGHRFLTSVATTDDPATTARLIRKFVASSSKSVALDAISHLVTPVNTSFSRLSPLAFPVSQLSQSICYLFTQSSDSLIENN